MATKKQAPKSSRSKGGKTSRASKPAKKSSPKMLKPVSKSSSKRSKTAIKTKGTKNVASKPAHSSAAKGFKKGFVGKKASKNKSGNKQTTLKVRKPIVVKKTAPPKLRKNLSIIKKSKVKPAEPVKKPAIGAKTHREVKPTIKPLVKPAVKKEPTKPVVIPKTSTTKAVKYEPEFIKSVLDNQPKEASVPTMRYSDTELIEFRDLINKKLDTAKKELTYLQGLITRKDESGDMEDGRYMTMEDGSMSMEREQLSQMASRQIQFIDHLEKALMRIENKTYGICRVTGKLIDKARLRAVPHATLSIEAKQMMSR
ncbi:MAG: TraR/DksA family transcriptional regulator [Chitinophagaceae bacterium]